jgi:hypothetical protein
MLSAGDSAMEWTLRLVGMGIDGQSLSSTLAISGGIAGEIDQSDQLG